MEVITKCLFNLTIMDKELDIDDLLQLWVICVALIILVLQAS